MTVHVFHAPPPAPMGLALEGFEAQFRYPLGKATSFSISHGRDYITFFAAIGDATLVVAEHQGHILGTLAAATRPLQLPDGSTRRTAYLGDLKIAPTSRNSVALGRILETMHTQLANAGIRSAYGVVMDGTGRIPPNYTGRLSIPEFTQIAQLSILQITTAHQPAESPTELPFIDWMHLHKSLPQRGVSSTGGTPALRSKMPPAHLGTHRACGYLEDTRLAKRLLISPGKELHAAHLSQLAFEEIPDAALLLRQAINRCAALGIPTLFTATPPSIAPALINALSGIQVQIAQATIFGCGFGDISADWWLDTSEI